MKHTVFTIARNLIIISAMALVLTMYNCDTSPVNIDRPDPFKPVEGITGNIRFWIGESHDYQADGSDPSLTLFLMTEYIYPCCNFSIQQRLFRFGNKITVDLLGIYVPAICLTALGPATSQPPINIHAGTYELRFILGGEVDRFTLHLTDASISVTGDDTGFMICEYPLVWRYPPKSFAYLCGTTTETSWMCSEFLDSLLAAGLYEQFQFPDYGLVPYPKSSGGHYYDMPALYFTYERERDFDAAGDILARYANTTTKHYQGVGLSLVNWRKEWYSSWLLEE
jgi:hypothetical protein